MTEEQDERSQLKALHFWKVKLDKILSLEEESAALKKKLKEKLTLIANAQQEEYEAWQLVVEAIPGAARFSGRRRS